MNPNENMSVQVNNTCKKKDHTTTSPASLTSFTFYPTILIYVCLGEDIKLLIYKDRTICQKTTKERTKHR